MSTTASTPNSAAASAPFFILGCVRSGTTMLRNILRLHPNLACPEETHYFRWGEPFAGPIFTHTTTQGAVLKKHREIDGITDDEFKGMLEASTSRADLCERYMRRYIQVKKPQARRWFDKTPQNAYGAAMIACEFPQARFVHIVRDPVDVVASLRIGKVIKLPNLVAACAYWNEAAENLYVLRRAFPDRVLDIRYDAFTVDPMAGVKRVLDFVGEPYEPAVFRSVDTKTVRHEQSGVLTPAEVAQVRQLCLQGRRWHGFTQPGE